MKNALFVSVVMLLAFQKVEANPDWAFSLGPYFEYAVADPGELNNHGFGTGVVTMYTQNQNRYSILGRVGVNSFEESIRLLNVSAGGRFHIGGNQTRAPWASLGGEFGLTRQSDPVDVQKVRWGLTVDLNVVLTPLKMGNRTGKRYTRGDLVFGYASRPNSRVQNEDRPWWRSEDWKLYTRFIVRFGKTDNKPK